MAVYCPLEEVLRAQPTLEGAGVKLNRAFGYNQAPRFDPFLLLDDFGSHDPEDYLKGFPWHPHRGIETVTYMLSGEVEHGDSLGNEGIIRDGEVQWMTAGGGIIHQEMPQRYDGRFRGFQLWINLPRSDKMMVPRYRDITAGDIPAVDLAEGVLGRMVAGEVNGSLGPAPDLIVPVQYLVIQMEPGARYDHPVPAGYRGFAYLFEGTGTFSEASKEVVEDGQVVRFGKGDRVLMQAGEAGMRLLFAAGTPLNEPVAWGGPIVMNSRGELKTAFDEYKAGTFLKHKPRGVE
ncbi:pirin family protein [bacterium]|nr:pirin family protein [bacterium]